MSAVCRLALAAWLLAAGASAQERWYLGVKGGVPLSDHEFVGVVGRRPDGGGLRRVLFRPYSVGASVEAGLPCWKLAVEVDALYKRADAEEEFFYSRYSYGHIDRYSWNSWEFPMLLRRGWRVGRVAPFAAAGGVVRIETGKTGNAEVFQVGFPGVPPTFVRPIEGIGGVGLVQGGWVGGGGVRLRTWRGLAITTELRYTRYTSLRSLPTRNQVEFLFGFGFGGR